MPYDANKVPTLEKEGLLVGSLCGNGPFFFVLVTMGSKVVRLYLTCGYHYDGRLVETSRQLAAAKLLLHTVEDVFPKHRRAAVAQLYKSSIIAWHRQFKNREPLPGISPPLTYFCHSRNLVGYCITRRGTMMHSVL